MQDATPGYSTQKRSYELRSGRGGMNGQKHRVNLYSVSEAIVIRPESSNVFKPFIRSIFAKTV